MRIAPISTNGFVRFVRIHVIRVSNSSAPDGLAAFAMRLSPSGTLLGVKAADEPNAWYEFQRCQVRNCVRRPWDHVTKKTTRRPQLPDAVSRTFNASTF